MHFVILIRYLTGNLLINVNGLKNMNIPRIN